METKEKNAIDKFIADYTGYALIICITIVLFLGYVTQQKGGRNNILKRQQLENIGNRQQ